MSADRRKPKKPLATLDEELTTLTEEFTNVVTKDYDENSAEEIDQICSELKDVKIRFEEKSRELEKAYRDAASIADSRNIKKQRLDLSRETYDLVKVLNTCRKNLELESISNHSPHYQQSLCSVITKDARHNTRENVQNNVESVDNEEPAGYEESVDNEEPTGYEELVDIEEPVDVEETLNSMNRSSANGLRESVRSKLKTKRESDLESPSPAASFLLKSELMKRPVETFSGVSGSYRTWATILKDRMNCINLTGIEQLQVLHIHTCGRPQELVKDYLSVATTDSAESAVQSVWATFEERYNHKLAGAQIIIERLKKLPFINSIEDEDSITRMLDACRNAVCSMESSPQLQWLNTYEGINMLSSKLTDTLRSRWRTFGIRSKEASGRNPNLSVFVGFLQRLYKESVDDFFKWRPATTPRDVRQHKPAKVFLTEGGMVNPGNNKVSVMLPNNNHIFCYVHNSKTHDLKDCATFSNFNREMKVAVVKENRLCFRCLGKHYLHNCNAPTPKCNICCKPHLTILHYHHDDRTVVRNSNRVYHDDRTEVMNSNRAYSDDRSNVRPNSDRAKATLTSIDEVEDDHCVFSKTFMVEIGHADSDTTIRGIAILDDQSNRCFTTRKLIEDLSINAPNHSYCVETLSGLTTNIEGKLVSGLKVRRINSDKWYNLPNALTSDNIPDTRHEMASPSVVNAIPHLRSFAQHFHTPINDVEPVILIGADAGELMNCESYGQKSPYIHRTPLGYALVGPVPKRVLRNCQLSYPPPKLHSFRTSYVPKVETSFKASELFSTCGFRSESKIDVFERQDDDELKGLSVANMKFLNTLEAGVKIDDSHRVVLPLPFKTEPQLPNNRVAVFHRTASTLNKLKKDESKLNECRNAIAKNLQLSHVEEVPASRLPTIEGRSWWLPVFPVTHPQKGTARLVFDASAAYQKVSLNDVLLQGPDLNNDLRAVLLRFRSHPVAFTCDIKHMFQNFIVPEDQRDYLRFFWWRDNNPDKAIVEYRSNVHLFGARSSPSIAEFALKYIVNVEKASGNISSSTAEFINDNFYVDDGHQSCVNSREAIVTLEETKSALSKYHLELHKINSNSADVVKHFSHVDAETPPNTKVRVAPESSSRTLGVEWETHSDNMVVTINVPDRPFTRRGILASVNGLFDPIGMIAPVVLCGRLIQREAMTGENSETQWDAPLPDAVKVTWDKWKEELKGVSVSIPRCLFPYSTDDIHLHVFADASLVAIGFVIYATSVSPFDNNHVSFVVGGSKVAPKSATTIPRLELCAALEASFAVNNIMRHLKVKIEGVSCYTDSKIVCFP